MPYFFYSNINIFMFIIRPNPKIEGMIGAAQGALCLASGIFGLLQNPQMLLQGLKNFATDLAASALATVLFVVQSRVNQILGLVDGILNKYLGLINAILDNAKLVVQMDNFIMDRQQCINMAANLISCIAASARDDITSKIAMQTDKAIGPTADKIVGKLLKTDGVMENFIFKHDKFVQKATTQNKLLL